jgi:hypothetical protein
MFPEIGRGLIQLEEAYILEIMEIMEYVDSKADSLLQIVKTRQHKLSNTKECLKPRRKITKRKRINKGHHNTELKGKMARKNNAWTIPTSHGPKIGG